jgi:hypothetical protein
MESEGGNRAIVFEGMDELSSRSDNGFEREAAEVERKLPK